MANRGSNPPIIIDEMDYYDYRTNPDQFRREYFASFEPIVVSTPTAGQAFYDFYRKNRKAEWYFIIDGQVI